MRVLLVIDGLAAPGPPGASGEPAVIPGTDALWTQRWVSGLLLVEGAPNAGDAVRDLDRMKDAGTDELRKAFRPEFLNRIDDTIVFHSLKELPAGLFESIARRFNP